ncbi:MAG: ACP S-malonyltransferase, partial [Holosporales bacterium]
KDLFDAFPVARDIIQRVDDALKQNLSTLMFEGPLDLLTQTQNAQPALFAVSVAVLRVLETEGGESFSQAPRVVAGHSLGEYSALVSADVLKLEEAAELLRLRGKAMQQAVPEGEGGMAALLNLSLDQLHALPEVPGEICVVANDNSLGQVVVSGHVNAIRKAVEWAKSEGGNGILLNVSGPFHSPLMVSAQEVMGEVIEKIKFRTPRIPVITNISGSPQQDPAVLKDHLIRQLTERVRWRETMEAISHMKLELVAELGAGSVLMRLARRHMPTVKAFSVEKPQEIEAFLKEWSTRKSVKNHA